MCHNLAFDCLRIHQALPNVCPRGMFELSSTFVHKNAVSQVYCLYNSNTHFRNMDWAVFVPLGASALIAGSILLNHARTFGQWCQRVYRQTLKGERCLYVAASSLSGPVFCHFLHAIFDTLSHTTTFTGDTLCLHIAGNVQAGGRVTTLGLPLQAFQKTLCLKLYERPSPTPAPRPVVVHTLYGLTGTFPAATTETHTTITTTPATMVEGLPPGYNERDLLLPIRVQVLSLPGQPHRLEGFELWTCRSMWQSCCLAPSAHGQTNAAHWSPAKHAEALRHWIETQINPV